MDPRPPGSETHAERAIVDLPRDVALFWVQWSEAPPAGLQELLGRGSPAVSGEPVPSLHDALVTSGPILCNDIEVGPATAGRVPACVPFVDRAVARLVASPPGACRR